MSRFDILRTFYDNSANFTPKRIILVLSLGLIMALIIFLTYRFTYRGVSYNSGFNAANVQILLVTVVIMIMISSNIAISIGMVGALSIIRFRTAVKDPRDTAFIFWSIIEGLCIGSQNFILAILSTVFIAIIVVVLSGHVCFHKKYLIIIRGERLRINDVEQILSDKKYQIRTMNTIGDSVEIIAELAGKRSLDAQLIDKLNQLPGVQSTNWLLETEENIG